MEKLGNQQRRLRNSNRDNHSDQQTIDCNVDHLRRLPAMPPERKPACQRHYLKIVPKLIGLSISLSAGIAVAADIAQVPLFLTSTVRPNIMLMLDNSISMGGSLTMGGSGAAYDATKTYPLGGACSTTALPANGDTDSQTNCTNTGIGSWTGRPRRCSITYSTTIPNSFYGRTVGSRTGTQCFSASKSYTTSGLSVVGSTNAQKANWLNWYYANEIQKLGTTSTRLQVAKNSANSLVDSLSSDVRLGFSTFNNDDGGTLWEVVDTLGDTKKANIRNRINNSTASANTPLAETMADIGHYFAQGTNTNVTLRKGKTGEASAAKASVLPSALNNQTAWTGRTAISGEPAYSDSPIQYRCQKSYAVLLTDGLPSSDRDISSNTYLADYDGDCSGTNSSNCGINSGSGWTTPHYDMKRAYNYPGTCNTGSSCINGGGSNSSDYFDDVTKALYEMDLRPDKRDLSKEVASAKNNLTTYVVGFADDAINPTIPGVNPLPKDAAEVGGGKFFYAGNEGELTASLVRTFQQITEDVSSSSSVAASATQFETSTYLFQAVFESGKWRGDIRAFLLQNEDTNGNGKLDVPPDVSITEDTNGNGKLDIGGFDINNPSWLASERIPSFENRHIFTYDAASAQGVEFFWDQLNSIQKQELDSANASKTNPDDSPVLNFLRGDRSDEGNSVGDYRERTSVLGDVVNSDPLFVSDQNFGYEKLPSPEGDDYKTFVDDKTDNQDMLYFGANDGMLHAIQVGSNPPSGTEIGQEIFAYVPNAVISKELATLKDKNYTHRYFVDGGPQFGDAYFTSDNKWHTVLLGSTGAGSTTAVGGATGAGGHGVFALDITNPSSFNEKNVMWEFTNRHDVDLGYTIPSPGVVRMANGRFAAIVANGYNSVEGNAVLFILDIETGTQLAKITANDPASNTTKDNGLSTPAPVDDDGDGIIDSIYAGDLKGNLWKFDVTDNDPANWDVAYKSGTTKLPVYVARDVDNGLQAITAQPLVVKADSTDQTSGYMVYFGTGTYYTVDDQNVPATPQLQTFYGIWDTCDLTSPTGCSGVVSGRGSLQKQTILNELTDTLIGQDIRITTDCEVAYGATLPTTTAAPCSGTTNRRGWYMDLVADNKTRQGERVVSPAILRDDAIVFVTVIPTNVTCDPGGTSWLMETSVSGSRFTGSSPFDVNADNEINDSDKRTVDGKEYVVTGLKSKIGIMEKATIVVEAQADTQTDNCRENKYFSGSNSDMMQLKEKHKCNNPPPTPGGGGVRKSWRQLR